MFTIPLLVLAGIWWLVCLAVRNGRREHQQRPPFPTRVPAAPPPPQKPEPVVVHIRLL